MTQETQSEQRFAAIEAKQGQADMLLAEARQEPLKEQVVLALRDLDEGLRWLRKEDKNARPFVLEIVDAIVRLATFRLNMVKKALQTDGPNALAATPPFRNAD